MAGGKQGNLPCTVVSPHRLPSNQSTHPTLLVPLPAPALQGFEIGSGFSGSRMLGSEHNDEFFMDESGEVRTRTNR